jgi:hypothetical protein
MTYIHNETATVANEFSEIQSLTNCELVRLGSLELWTAGGAFARGYLFDC